FDQFLSELAARELKVFIISGNHDSAERVAFGGRIMNRAGVFVSPVYDGKIEGIPLGGDVFVYLMPFVREYTVRAVFPEREINTITDAARAVIENIALDKSKINILAAHQFVTGTADGSDVERGGDQAKAVGGVDNIDAGVFKDFDYVALGHIHRSQRAGSDNVRYCGSPLKYSFDEANRRKAIVVLETGGKGDIKTREIPLVPLRELRVFEGNFSELMARECCDDYVKIILTETGVLDARIKLSKNFTRIAEIEFKAESSSAPAAGKGIKEIGTKTPADIIKEFFTQQNGSDMTDEQAAICDEILESIKEAE
ncbi:MAG: exonuclease SbcCD subunit D C-terminal domain-containing protein, partial [Oscillospiraceae bacterium]|nr:exonuclease SbcCD subunit D C-terminal domain-containing protein [Oscillospiraceae bacterium]